MKYMLLIYGQEAQPGQEVHNDESNAEMAAYFAYTAETQQRGVFVAAEALLPTHTATTVRVRSGKILTTDGPFAESHEHLGGFYLLDCKDLDEAIELAAKIPGALSGSIEIRPVVVFE